METVDTLITGARLVTMDAQRRVIADGAIAIAGGRIVAVGPTADIVPQVAPRERVDARGRIATPGLVNGHVHLTETLIRGFVPEDLDFADGLFNWVIPLYQAHGPAEQAIAAQLAVVAMLTTGTTTFVEAGTLLDPDAVRAAIAPIGMRGRIGRWIMDRAFDPAQDQTALTDAAIATIAADLDAARDQDDLLATWPLLVGHATNTPELWRAATAMARERGLGIAAHMSPDPADPAFYGETYGCRPVEWLARLDALGPHLALVHMVHVDQGEVDLLAQSGTHVVFCPGAAMRGGYGAGPHGRHAAMARAGVTLALGTDGGDAHDLWQQGRLFAGLLRDAAADPVAVTAEATLEAMTLGGARAAGLEGQVGALAVGYQADIVLIDTDRSEWAPLWHAPRHLVWSGDGRAVDSVWVAGRKVVEAGRCLTIDQERLFALAREAAPQVIARTGLPLRSPWPLG